MSLSRLFVNVIDLSDTLIGLKVTALSPLELGGNAAQWEMKILSRYNVKIEYCSTINIIY